MSLQLVVPTDSMPSKEQVDKMQDPYQQRANREAIAKAESTGLLVLAQSVVRLRWLIDNNSSAVIVPLTSNLDISLDDMRGLQRRAKSAQGPSPSQKSSSATNGGPQDHGLDDAITIGRLQFKV